MLWVVLIPDPRAVTLTAMQAPTRWTGKPLIQLGTSTLLIFLASFISPLDYSKVFVLPIILITLCCTGFDQKAYGLVDKGASTYLSRFDQTGVQYQSCTKSNKTLLQPAMIVPGVTIGQKTKDCTHSQPSTDTIRIQTHQLAQPVRMQAPSGRSQMVHTRLRCVTSSSSFYCFILFSDFSFVR